MPSPESQLPSCPWCNAEWVRDEAGHDWYACGSGTGCGPVPNCPEGQAWWAAQPEWRQAGFSNEERWLKKLEWQAMKCEACGSPRVPKGKYTGYNTWTGAFLCGRRGIAYAATPACDEIARLQKVFREALEV